MGQNRSLNCWPVFVVTLIIGSSPTISHIRGRSFILSISFWPIFRWTLCLRIGHQWISEWSEWMNAHDTRVNGTRTQLHPLWCCPARPFRLNDTGPTLLRPLLLPLGSIIAFPVLRHMFCTLSSIPYGMCPLCVGVCLWLRVSTSSFSNAHAGEKETGQAPVGPITVNEQN